MNEDNQHDIPSTDSTDADERDREDMMRLAFGRDAALNDLMERHSGKMMSCLIRCLQNEGAAADLMQETFVHKKVSN